MYTPRAPEQAAVGSKSTRYDIIKEWWLLLPRVQ